MLDMESSTSYLNDFEVLMKARFNKNWAIAEIVYMAAATRSFSVALKGPSSAGKSTLANQVLEMVPTDGVMSLTRCSTAAMLRMSDVKVVLCDELVTDKNLAHVRRHLISNGRATGNIVVGGNIRTLDVIGPVAFIDCVPPGTRQDIQDTSRLLTLRLSDSDEQINHHAAAAIKRQTRAGREEQECWRQAAEASRTWIAKIGDAGNIIVDIEVQRLIPRQPGNHISRRIEQVLSVAKAITLMTREPDFDGVTICGEDEIRRALKLLLAARAEDDHEHLTEETRRLGNAVGQSEKLVGPDATKTFTIKDLLEELNTVVGYCGVAQSVIKANKRRGGGHIKFTNRIVTPHLKNLENATLLERVRQGRAYGWRFTNAGRAWLECGSMNSFVQILVQLNNTADGGDVA